MPDGKKLPQERLGAAIATISSWRQFPSDPVPCPACGQPGLQIVDRSARPYAEWYVLLCNECGLDHTLHLPMAPPTFGGD